MGPLGGTDEFFYKEPKQEMSVTDKRTIGVQDLHERKQGRI